MELSVIMLQLENIGMHLNHKTKTSILMCKSIKKNNLTVYIYKKHDYTDMLFLINGKTSFESNNIINEVFLLSYSLLLFHVHYNIRKINQNEKNNP